jgi:hypothetical protein
MKWNRERRVPKTKAEKTSPGKEILAYHPNLGTTSARPAGVIYDRKFPRFCLRIFFEFLPFFTDFATWTCSHLLSPPETRCSVWYLLGLASVVSSQESPFQLPPLSDPPHPPATSPSRLRSRYGSSLHSFSPWD